MQQNIKTCGLESQCYFTFKLMSDTKLEVKVKVKTLEIWVCLNLRKIFKIFCWKFYCLCCSFFTQTLETKLLKRIARFCKRQNFGSERIHRNLERLRLVSGTCCTHKQSWHSIAWLRRESSTSDHALLISNEKRDCDFLRIGTHADHMVGQLCCPITDVLYTKYVRVGVGQLEVVMSQHSKRWNPTERRGWWFSF